MLVGDNGYPVKPYLITPLLNPASEEENVFNVSKIRTPNPVGRSLGTPEHEAIQLKIHQI